MGADVVKVEDPSGGDWMRWIPPLRDGQSVIFNALNRNKRSLTLNLKSQAGRSLLLELVSRADALVEGNRPGVMARLGAGWETLRAANPRLIVCSITGYGEDGPLAGRVGHDLNYMAIAGALSLNGTPEAPLPLGVQVADIGGGGQAAAAAILGALLGVARGGEGRHLDVSMTDAAVTWITAQLAQAADEGRAPRRGGERLTGRYPCYRVYRCADGRFLSLGALEPKFWKALCDSLGRADLVPAQFTEGADADAAHRELEAVFATRSRDDWERTLDGLEVCCEPVLELDEVASHPQVVARGLIVDTPTGREVRPAVVLGAAWRRRPAPAAGEHTAEVLAEIGVGEEQLAELHDSGAV
jgi:crotonobetainyl-CoA:carnitine CoA-transferase CaiB-like acyl-CoA transferase